MIGSDSSATDYPGRIPSGPDLSSDNADENDREDAGSGSLQKWLTHVMGASRVSFKDFLASSCTSEFLIAAIL